MKSRPGTCRTSRPCACKHSKPRPATRTPQQPRQRQRRRPWLRCPAGRPSDRPRLLSTNILRRPLKRPPRLAEAVDGERGAAAARRPGGRCSGAGRRRCLTNGAGQYPAGPCPWRRVSGPRFGRGDARARVSPDYGVCGGRLGAGLCSLRRLAGWWAAVPCSLIACCALPTQTPRHPQPATCYAFAIESLGCIETGRPALLLSVPSTAPTFLQRSS
jgi:hypothetical protein